MAAVGEERQDALGVFAISRRSRRGEDCMRRYREGQCLLGNGLELAARVAASAQALCQNSAINVRDLPCKFMLSRPV